MARFTLYINFFENIIERPLPAEDNRSVCIDLSDIAENCKIKLEVFDNVWNIFSDTFNKMSISGVEFSSHQLIDGDIIKVCRNDYNFTIMVYEITANITQFKKYSIAKKNIIRIGKSDAVDIYIDSKYISVNHATIENRKGTWFCNDTSLNGTYINDKRIKDETKLNMFDIISTVGFKAVFLGEYIAINRADIVVCRLSCESCNYSVADNICTEQMFSPSPRAVVPLFDDVIEIEAPPSPTRQRNQPLIFIIGPSVTMPLPILMSTYINSLTNNNSARSYVGIIASVGMSAFIAAGWAIAHYVYNNKVRQDDENFRITAYQDYIAKNQQLIIDRQNYDSSVLIEQFLSSSDIMSRLSKDISFIWNRNVNQEDFLCIRLGMGNVDFSSHISVPKQRFSLFKDDMSELPHQLYERYKYISNAVVTLSLKKAGILGIIGKQKYINNVSAAMIVQTVALHCYTDVRIAVFFKETEYKDFSWVRWFPHVNSEDIKIRMVACEHLSYQSVLYHIDEILRQRTEKLNESNKETNFYPHYIVFCSDRDIFDGDSIEKYIPMAESLGFTFILAYEYIDRLPNECNNIIQYDDEFSGYYTLTDKRRESDKVQFDLVHIPNAELFAKKLSGFRVREYATGEIPNSIDYFDMIGIGKLEQWDLIKKYKENRVYEGIRSFVGIGSGGKPVYIDIHEKKYGPHGLVAGTTGSGKSETLQTFIISLALNYHPDEIAFILIDYKGGGMAFAFEGMPHIAGMITNLGSDGGESGEIDSNATRRALVSIRSEIKYRQSVFNKYKVNHIDSYIRLYRDKVADEALPHLIIISDEFAELKKEQPEFIKELVSTARVGRSLGIHLILATQKPGGVVDDEIWSNARFKLCLRVQDKQDSMGMLKRPEAAYLTQTGRAYLQIGNDEIFEQFQTGYSGADYIPHEEVGTASEADFYMINLDGSPAISKGHKQSKGKKAVKQLTAAVKYITDICLKNNIKNARALWMPALSGNMFLEDVTNNYPADNSNGIYAVFGLIDDPEKQNQYPAKINFLECSNLLISGLAGIGKTTMLQTMITSVIKNYSCEQVVFYILDFSSRTLKMFGNVKHCGLVAFSDDREAVTRLFKLLFNELDHRRDMFNEKNVGSYIEYVKSYKLPLCLVFIDNCFSFIELYSELADDFSRLSRDCAKYGIQIIITCNSFGDIRYKVRQNFVNILTLVMSEKSDYREAWGISAEFMPRNQKGRGLILSDGRLLEYQTALPCCGASETDRHDLITELINKVNERDEKLCGADKVKILPLGQSYEDFYAKHCSENIIPLGYNKENISAYNLELTDMFCYAVSGAESRSISLVMSNMVYAAKKCGGYVYVVKLKQDIKLNVADADKLCRNKDSVVDMLAAIREPFHQRAIMKKEFLTENPDGDFAEYICGKSDRIFIFIDSMNEFLDMIYDKSNTENMYSITEAYFKNGKGMGIYFIAGFDPSVFGHNYYQPACKEFTAYRQSVHFGGKFDKQKLVETSMTMSQMSKPSEYYSGVTNYGGNTDIFIPGGQPDERFAK